MGGAASCARRLLVLLRNTNNRKLTQSIDRSIDRLRASGLRAGPYLGAGPGQDLSTRKVRLRPTTRASTAVTCRADIYLAAANTTAVPHRVASSMHVLDPAAAHFFHFTMTNPKPPSHSTTDNDKYWA